MIQFSLSAEGSNTRDCVTVLMIRRYGNKKQGYKEIANLFYDSVQN